MNLTRYFQKRKDRYLDIFSILLLLLAFWALSTRLDVTEWSAVLFRGRLIALFGLAAGLALGYSRFGWRTILFLAGVYGIFLVIHQLGSNFSSYVLWRERLDHLLSLFIVTFTHFISNQQVTDLILFNLMMYSLMWGMAVFAGFILTRHKNAWLGLMPAALFIITIQNFDGLAPFRPWYLAFFLLTWVVLAARVYQQQNREKLLARKTKLPLYFNWDMLRYSSIFITLLVVFAWITPVVASTIPPVENIWEQITAPFDFMEDEFNNIFFPLRQPGLLQNDYYGSQLPLGNGNFLSDQVILNVKTPGNYSSNIRYYWRVRVYDSYLDGGWSSSHNEMEWVPSNNLKVFTPEYNGREFISVDITPGIPLTSLYTLPQPLQFSPVTNITFASNPDGSLDISVVKPNETISPGEAYTIDASVSAATISELYAAGTDYPEWVTERYLAVPDGITERTRQLSDSITDGLENPYEITHAISEYLRENIEYAETIEDIPDEQDPLDWFLFDYQQGFCNYYASSMVILLRLQGIPARLAVGYAQGERITQKETVIDEKETGRQNLDEIEQNVSSEELYIVRQKDAHAWPEVYFPGIGWVEFEPTANQIPIFRTQGDAVIPEGDQVENNTEEENPVQTPEAEDDSMNPEETANEPDAPVSTTRTSPYTVLLLVLGAIAVIAASIFGWKTARDRGIKPLPVLVSSSMEKLRIKPPRPLKRWAKNASLSPISRAYHQINAALKRLKHRPQPDLTPAERAALLSRLMPEAADLIDTLLEEYERERYSPYPADLVPAREAAQAIAWRSRLYWFRNWFTRFQDSPDDERGTLLELNS